MGPVVAQTDFESLTALADTLSPSDVDYIWEGIEMNERISRHGFENEVGLGLGRAVRDAAGPCYAQDLAAKIKAVSAAASDARTTQIGRASCRERV